MGLKWRKRMIHAFTKGIGVKWNVTATSTILTPFVMSISNDDNRYGVGPHNSNYML